MGYWTHKNAATMVSFVCESCGDTIKKPKLVQHFQRCGAPFTCLDCNKTFPFGEFQKHSSCISEAQKYEKSVWKGDKPKKGQKQGQNGQQKMPPAPPPVEASKTEEIPVATTPAPLAAPAAEPAQVEEKKKSRKDKKRKLAEGDKSVDDSALATAAAQIPAVETEAPAAPAAPQAADDAELSSRKAKKQKRKSKGTKGETSVAPPAAEIETAPVNGDSAAAPTLESVLAQSLADEGAKVTLQEILEKAGQSKEVLEKLQVQKGKKGKYVLTLA